MASHSQHVATASVRAVGALEPFQPGKQPGLPSSAASSTYNGTAAGTAAQTKQPAGHSSTHKLPKSATRPKPSGPFTLGSLLSSTLHDLEQQDGARPRSAAAARPQSSTGAALSTSVQSNARSTSGVAHSSVSRVSDRPGVGGHSNSKSSSGHQEQTDTQRTQRTAPVAARRHASGLLFGRKIDTIQYGLAQAAPPGPPSQPAPAPAGVRRPAFSYAAALTTPQPPPPPPPAATKLPVAEHLAQVDPPLQQAVGYAASAGMQTAGSAVLHGHGQSLAPTGMPTADGWKDEGVDTAAPVQTATKSTSAARSMMSLVRDAALRRDPAAIAELVRVLGPSDLSMLRLLAFKAEKKLQAAKAKAAETMEHLQVDAPMKSSFLTGKGLLGGPGSGGAGTIGTIAKPSSMSLSLFGAPLRQDAHASKAASAAEKEREKAERLLGLEAVIEDGFRTLEKEEKEKARQARKAAWSTVSGTAPAADGDEGVFGKAAHKSLVARIQREKLVRAWIFTSLRAKMRDVRAAATAATQAHAHMLALQAKKAARAKAKLAAAAAAATSALHPTAAASASSVPHPPSALMGGALSALATSGGGSQAAGGAVTAILRRPTAPGTVAALPPTKSSKEGEESKAVSMGHVAVGKAEGEEKGDKEGKEGKEGGRPAPHIPAAGKTKLTKLKKILLRERMERWLDANPEAREVYSSARAVHLAVVDAQQSAEQKARADLRAAAEKAVRAKEARRLLRKIKKGKIAVPSVRKANAVGRMVLTPGEPGVYARVLAQRVVISRKRLRKEINKLVEAGKYTHPLTAAEEAAEKARAAAAGSGAVDADAGEQASLAAAVAPASAAAGDGDGDGPSERRVGSKQSSLELAERLAGLDITYSTRKSDIVKLVPKVRPLAGGSVPATPAAAAPPATAAAQESVSEHSEGVQDVSGVDGEVEDADVSSTSSEEDAAGVAPPGHGAGGGGAGGTVGPIPRAYVDQEPSTELDEIITEMISTALFYQEKAKKGAEEEAKGKILKSKRRLLSGLREVAKGCRNGKVKMVVVAPNIDQSSADGGLDDAVGAILHAARSADPPVPVVFALNRRKLGRALGTTLRASVVGVLSFENMRGMHNRAVELAQQLRTAWAWNRSEEGKRAKAAAAEAEKAAAVAAKEAAAKAKEEAKAAKAALKAGGSRGKQNSGAASAAGAPSFHSAARWQSALAHAGQVPDFVPSSSSSSSVHMSQPVSEEHTQAAWAALYASQAAALGTVPGPGPLYYPMGAVLSAGGMPHGVVAPQAEHAVAAANWAQYMAWQASSYNPQG